MSDDHLDKVRTIFLSPDLDEETRKDNEEKIIEWQKALARNRAYADWKESDITKEITLEAKRRYKQAAMTLALNRNLDERTRFTLWAEQDAASLILALTNEDAKAAIGAIHKEIQTALNATN